ncbi:CubicO group peptidase (beta-lactamase class C family) [Peribacillus deserti]|uniref:CubicO group peptidase (Beta-lactamase class C family) n=1 Tax=Peribacillus deserti TaxID=673318 RepID=A0ABS2QE00_9BACI|nr:penicillin binding protein PBP4B [Peribacillus deserti]MBM7691317.1 CubicO group peptidase (beta-lactamase class C family) [Peribacillus deserti]
MNKLANCTVTSLLTVSLLAAVTPAAFAGTNHTASSKSSYDEKKQSQYPVLRKAKTPEEAGFSSEKLQKVDAMIQKEVDEGFPGAVLLVIKDGKVVKNTAYGYAKKYSGLTPLKNPQKMKKDTMFDLASNTKMYSVNFALQQLVSKGKLDINQTVQHYIPEFQDQPSDVIKGKDKLKIIDILHHSAGFPADPQYHNPAVSKDLYSQDRNTTLKMISKTPLQYEPGTKNIYSDVDYMLLGYIIEKITGERLDQYISKHIYKPLGLKHTTFNPLDHGFKTKEFAATELMGNTRDGVISFPNIRTYTLQGEVHDEKAYYAMDGISGHAGLFSNTGDLAVLLQVMINNGGYGAVKFFDKKTIDQFVAPSDMNPTYGLGWRRNGNESMEWMFGPYADENVVGHTGWTGTVTVIDRKKNLGIVLLTNKKHSPLINNKENPNKSAGDVFNTGQYGSVVTGVYESLLENQK